MASSGLAAALFGCETYPDIEARPFFSTNRSKLFQRTETSALTPIFDHTTDEKHTEWAIHPLWRRIRTKTETEVQVLSPLFEYRDSSFKTDDEVARILTLPVLAVVPLMQSAADERRAFRNRLLIGAGLGTTVLGCLAVVLYTMVR